jgi:uncharacterized membrane protein
MTWREARRFIMDRRSTEEHIKRLVYAALFAALAFVGFQFFKIDIYIPGSGDKTAFHFGNTFVVLAAFFLGGLWGGIAGGIGLAFADILDPVYITGAPKTFILKLFIGLIAGAVAHYALHISRPQSTKKILWKSAVAASAGLVFNIVADPLFGYFYKVYVLGQTQDFAVALTKMSAVTTSVNAVISIIMSVIIYTALRPLLEKSGLFFRLEKDVKESGQKADISVER